jgi:hypothetical protein
MNRSTFRGLIDTTFVESGTSRGKFTHFATLVAANVPVPVSFPPPDDFRLFFPLA